MSSRFFAVAVLALSACAGSTPKPTPEEPGAAPKAAVIYPDAAWQLDAPEQHGLTAAGLEAMHGVAEQYGSTCMLVIHDGVLVDEWYAPGYDGAKQHANVFSVTKSVTSTLVGLAAAQGKLSIDDPGSKYIDGWVGTDSEAVAVRNLLSNDSGRFWSMESDYTNLLGGADQTTYAVGISQAAPAGTIWEYNNAAIQTLEVVLERAIGTDIQSFANTNLFEPIGMRATFMQDGAGNHLTYQGISTSCHDLARFGYLFLRGGKWREQQVVPEAWVREATQSSTALNAGYGLLWWLNREGHLVEPTFGPNRVERDGRFAPSSGEQVFFALGAFGQFVAVDPVGEYVVVRLQEVLDLQATLASDPDAVGLIKYAALMEAFEQAKSPP